MKGRDARAPALWHLEDPGPPDGAYVALAPGADLPLLPLDLPDKLTGLARERVAQRVITDKLALPKAGLELRPWRRAGKAWDRILVADAEDLAGWRGRLTDGCTGLLPDYLGLPCIPGVWTVAVDASVRARLGEGDGFTAEPSLAAALLAEAPAPKAVLRLGEPSEPVDAALADKAVPLFHSFDDLAAAGHGTPLPWAQSVRGLDLKAPPTAGFDRIRSGLRQWTAPVLVAAMALGVWIGSVLVETRDLQARAEAARAASEAMVRAHFVPNGPILDMRAQVSAALAQAAPPPTPKADALVLFQMAAPFLAGDAVVLQAISYRADSGLVAVVELTDFAALDRLVADLRAGGFAVEELDSAARQAGGVAASLRLLDGET